jgi:hypothetical protein
MVIESRPGKRHCFCLPLHQGAGGALREALGAHEGEAVGSFAASKASNGACAFERGIEHFEGKLEWSSLLAAVHPSSLGEGVGSPQRDEEG